VGIDETLERRYGKKIAARDVYRDPVRSTHETFVKSSGLRWVCAMLLVEVSWASRVWALPFLSALAPSERYAAERGRRHKKIVSWFVMRWQIEVSFQEMRRHLGFESQGQWSDLAIQRTTPALLGLFSLVTLFAHLQMRRAAGAYFRRRAGWYHKAHPSFADALALVRKELWAREQTFYTSRAEADTVKAPRAYVERLTDAVCYAA
jgi:hypothetical protein